MKFYLAKTEPNEYSIEDLEKAGTDKWDGVRNFRALSAIKKMKVGEAVLIYHSGKNPGVVGLAKVAKEAVKNPNDPISWTPEFTFVRKFPFEVSLAEIKGSHKFDDWLLVRQGRLSTMEVPESFIDLLKSKGFNLSV